MSASLQEYEDVESEGGSVLVDWGVGGSTKSVPARASKIIDTGRNAISLYDSDSSDEMRLQPRRSSLLSILRPNLTDDENSVDDLMILSDDDDDADSEEEHDTLTRVQDSLASTGKVITPSTPLANSLASNGSDVSNNNDSRRKGEIAAVFVEDKPWRELTPWRRRTQGASMLSKFRTTEQSSDHKVENEMENGIQRLKGSIFRNISLTATMLHDHPSESMNNREQKEKDLLDQSMDDDDDDDFEEVSIHSSQLSELDLDERIGWDSLPPLPNSFLGAGMLHPSMSQYLDTKLQHNHISHADADRFAVEQSLLLRAILQLLEERAVRGVAQMNMDDGIVLKQGALKKFSHSVGRPTWKVKYAEVRRGTFSYYEDSADASKKARKTIPLSGCICQESRNRVGCFVFELLPENCPRRLFMCSSEEERQSWLRVIKEAKQEKKTPINLNPYQWSIDTYRALQTSLRWSLSKGEYLLHFGDVTKLKLQIPVQWTYEETNEWDEREIQKQSKPKAIDFWKFLDKQTFVINGHEILGGSLHGRERTIGALSRCILEYDHSSQEEHAQHDLLEVQAVSYARDVLVACWQSRARDDSHYALDNMCQNRNLVIVLPMSTNPKIYFTVSYSRNEDQYDPSVDSEVAPQVSGWVTSRSRTFRNWKNRYCVVSEGVLSYYEHANPRPHGLRGQVVLVGAVLNVVHEKAREDMHLHILQIVSKDHDRERQLSFRDITSFTKWKDAIQDAIDLCTPKDANSPPESPERRRKINRVIPTSRLMQKGMEGGGRMIAESGFKVIKGASNLFEKITRKNTDDAFLSNDLESYIAAARTEHPSVHVRVQSCRHYKIITADPTGDDETDTWITVRANNSQTFKLSGGANGRFASDDELVELDFFDGLVREDDTLDDHWKLHMSESFSQYCPSTLPDVSTNRESIES
jgi:hypothetical protein